MERIKNLIHYIIYQCEDPTKLGATKLNKILWFIDSNNYLKFGKPLTEATYIKLQFGPVPECVEIIKERLIAEGKIFQQKESIYGNYCQEKLFSLKTPDIDMFQAHDISMIDKTINIICDEHTARSISDLSHDDIWELAKIGEEIPFYTVLSKIAPLAGEDIAWANLSRSSSVFTF